MIEFKILRKKQDCSLCKKEIPKWGSAMRDLKKPAEKRYVHVECYEDLLKARGQWKEPPF